MLTNFGIGTLVRLPRWLPFVFVLAVALLLRRAIMANVDVSWMLTLCEKILDGQRLYVDLMELNPPGGILLYLPPVFVARHLGLRPETVTDIFVIAAACVSIALPGRVFDVRRFLKVDAWQLAAVTAAVLAILPARAFGDRDPVALIVLLPSLALYAVRAMRRPVPRAHAIIGGMSSALAAIIKPHFVLVIFVTAIVTAVCARSWRVLLVLENWVAAALLLAYGVAVAAVFPAFIPDVAPMVAAVYVARPPPVAVMLPTLALWSVTLLMILHWRGRAAFAPPFCILLAASCGCALVFMAQGKGWPYHSVPMLALALIALALAGNWFTVEQTMHEPEKACPALDAGWTPVFGKRSCTKNTGKSSAWLARTAGALAIAAGCFTWFNAETDYTNLARPVARIAARPTMLAITSDVAIGHPLVRDLGGVWALRMSHNWISSGVLVRRQHQTLDAATAAQLDAYEARERAMLADDIARSRPDVILVDRIWFDWGAWAREDPRLRELLGNYREADTVDGIAILARRPL